MLKSIQVNGFKSLADFKLEMQPGLNVLVGPNGSGKSNIMSLFEFLSFLTRYPLPEAVSRSGGAGNIFRRMPERRIKNEINIRVEGYGEFEDERRYFEPARRAYRKKYFVEYVWEFTITLSSGRTSVAFERQRLAFSLFRDPKQRTLVNRKTGERRWHIDIATGISDAGKVVVRRNKLNRSAFKRATDRSPTIFDDSIIRYLSDLRTFPIFTTVRPYYSAAEIVNNDISTGYIYNLNPSELKKPEDIARPAEILSDGSGFSAALYKIQESSKRTGPVPYYDRSYINEPNIDFNTLQEFFCLINNNIKSVSVDNNALENKLVAVAAVDGETGAIEIPLAMLSDGTVKWFALVTAILSDRAIFAIEEPENFLHPQMQREIVQIMKRNTDVASRFFLVTTHSETLINSLDPGDLIICDMVKGKTIAKRVENQEAVQKEINETGFGLGYYYISEVII